MGDVVTRLKVESQEYDAKLKNAVRQMNNMEQQVRRTGASFAYADKEKLAFVQSLGRMSTQATTAKGKISELTTAFTELSVQYQRLSAEEKASPFGKAMENSLQQLKGRIGELNGQLGNAKAEIQGTSGMLQQFAGKIGIPVQMLSKMGIALAAVGASLKVVGDALKQNELIFDEWGRVTKSAGAIYEGFLNALNTNSVDGYLRNINNIVAAARDAYDAMDMLGTFNAFNMINNERARTAFTQAMADYRSGEGSKGAVVLAGNELKSQLQTRATYEQQAYEAAINKLASTRGVDAALLKEALSGTYGSYQSLKAMPLTGRQEIMYTDPLYGTQTGTGQYTTVAANKIEQLGQMLRQLNDTELANIQQLGLQAQRTATEMAQVDKQIARLVSNKGVTTSTTTAPSASTAASGFSITNTMGIPAAGSLADLERQAAIVRNSLGGAMNNEEYSEMENHLNTILAQIRKIKGEKDVTFEPGSLNDLNQQLRDAQSKLAKLAPDTKAWAAAMQDVVEKQAAVNDLQQKMTLNGAVPEQAKDVSSLSTDWTQAANAVSAFGSALQSVEDPTAKVAGIIAQAIASVAAGAGGAIANAAKGDAGGPWGWLAFAISATATMVASIAAIKTATKYADGGMVGGNSYSGDNIIARLNSGEAVLNRRGIETAAALVDGAGVQTVEVIGKVSGEDILLVANNTNRSRGGSRGYYANIH